MTQPHTEFGFERPMQGVSPHGEAVSVVSSGTEMLEALQQRAARHLETAGNVRAMLEGSPGDLSENITALVDDANDYAKSTGTPEADEEAVIADEVAFREIGQNPRPASLVTTLEHQPNEPLQVALTEIATVEGDAGIKRISDVIENVHRGPDDVLESTDRDKRIAQATQHHTDAIRRVQRSIADIEGRFPSGSMPEGASRIVAKMKREIVWHEEATQEATRLAGETYDREQQRRALYGDVEPKRFLERYNGRLDMGLARTESHCADAAIEELLDEAGIAGLTIEDAATVVDAAIQLKRASQKYIMEKAENPMDGWDKPGLLLNDEIVGAIVPNIPRAVTRKLYGSQARFTSIIDARVADLTDTRTTLSPSESVCRMLDVLGVEAAADMVRMQSDESKGVILSKFKELLRVDDVRVQKEIDLRLEYYRRRIDIAAHGEDPGLQIATDMVVAMGIKPELASDIVRSASGDRGNQGLGVIGLEPALGIVSIAEKIDSLGVEVINTLHDEIGITSFHRYDTEQLQFMMKVIERDPEALEGLRQGDAFIAVLDATDDYNGAFMSNVDSLGARVPTKEKEEESHKKKRKSFIFEGGSMGGRYTTDTLLAKYADFLSDRGIASVDTIMIGGHGLADSGGIALGGLFLSLDEHSEQIDSEGMRKFLGLLRDGGTVILQSCSQGAISPEHNTSTLGEMVRIASAGRDRDIQGYGLKIPSAFSFSPEAGGAFTNDPDNTVAVYVGDDGRIHHDTTTGTRYVVPIRAYNKEGAE